MPKIAVVQSPPVLLNRQATLERAVELVGEAAAGGAELVVFPEAFVPGYPTWIWRLRPGSDINLTESLHSKMLDNAVDHASRDQSVPSVRLASRHDSESGYCIVTVADNGPGISPRQLEKIFEPFYTTRKEGSGLGLYIAKQLCEANQAELTVDSEPGQGAYFHIRLALAQPPKMAQ